MINLKRTLLVLLLAGAACVPAVSQAQISIAVGDQGYYTHGASYVSGGYRFAWVPGHWGAKHRWVHGHYVRRDRVSVGVGVGIGGISVRP